MITELLAAARPDRREAVMSDIERFGNFARVIEKAAHAHGPNSIRVRLGWQRSALREVAMKLGGGK